MRVQLKVTYGNNYERCKTSIINREKLIGMTLKEMANMVCNIVGGLFHGEEHVRMQYKDDEGTFVTMIDDMDIKDAVRSSVPVPQEDDMVRICLRIDKDFTPTNRKHSKSISPNDSEVTSPLRKRGRQNASGYDKRKSLFLSPDKDLVELMKPDRQPNTEMPAPKIDSGFSTPLQRFLDAVVKDVEAKKDKL